MVAECFARRHVAVLASSCILLTTSMSCLAASARPLGRREFENFSTVGNRVPATAAGHCGALSA